MPTLDSQVHAYERNHAGRPWIGTLYGPSEVTGDQMVAAMDAVSVDGAILVSPFSMYRYDASYALEVFAAHPSRFRLVKPVDPTDPTVVDTIADWASANGTVGIRIFLRDNASTDPADPAINRVLTTAAQHSQRGVYESPGSGETAGGAKSQYAAGNRPPRAATAA
jgi:L-fuconolactonase